MKQIGCHTSFWIKDRHSNFIYLWQCTIVIFKMTKRYGLNEWILFRHLTYCYILFDFTTYYKRIYLHSSSGIHLNPLFQQFSFNVFFGHYINTFTTFLQYQGTYSPLVIYSSSIFRSLARSVDLTLMSQLPFIPFLLFPIFCRVLPSLSI